MSAIKQLTETKDSPLSNSLTGRQIGEMHTQAQKGQLSNSTQWVQALWLFDLLADSEDARIRFRDSFHLDVHDKSVDQLAEAICLRTIAEYDEYWGTQPM